MLTAPYNQAPRTSSVIDSKRRGAANLALAYVKRYMRFKRVPALPFRQRTIALKSHRCAYVCATVRIPLHKLKPKDWKYTLGGPFVAYLNANYHSIRHTFALNVHQGLLRAYQLTPF